jgi:hypothetical protein
MLVLRTFLGKEVTCFSKWMTTTPYASSDLHLSLGPVPLERSSGGVSDSSFGFGASVQVTSNGEGGSDCTPPASVLSRNVEELDVILLYAGYGHEKKSRRVGRESKRSDSDG